MFFGLRCRSSPIFRLIFFRPFRPFNLARFARNWKAARPAVAPYLSKRRFGDGQMPEGASSAMRRENPGARFPAGLSVRCMKTTALKSKVKVGLMALSFGIVAATTPLYGERGTPTGSERAAEQAQAYKGEMREPAGAGMEKSNWSWLGLLGLLGLFGLKGTRGAHEEGEMRRRAAS